MFVFNQNVAKTRQTIVLKSYEVILYKDQTQRGLLLLYRVQKKRSIILPIVPLGVSRCRLLSNDVVTHTSQTYIMCHTEV